MEFGATYTFTSSEQFWSELEDVINLSPTDSSLEELDYALRNYISFVGFYMDEYLSSRALLSQSLIHLLTSPLFTTHQDRMTAQTIALISDTTSTRSILLVALMIILHLGSQNPLAPPDERFPDLDVHKVGGGKVFKAMRKRWKEVVPVLMEKVVEDESQREDDVKIHKENLKEGETEQERKHGWEDRVGTAAAAVLYEVCRVQRLNKDELSLFTLPFLTRLFHLVELSRDAEDETFNYTLIKLLIALNEQFMVVSLPAASAGMGLPPPILPKVLHGDNAATGDIDGNLVLEALRRMGADTRTFGENVIFILNRSNGTPDSLCVALLILKLLYLLFTTSGTHEYFYTNDLCVLVDVFIRELNDLGDESEGLKHTYLRVLHPLLTHTQLRNHPYKRPHLRRVLTSLISNSSFKDVDPTTKRLVERNLRGSWCNGLNGDSVGEGEKRSTGAGMGWSSGMGRRLDPATSASAVGEAECVAKSVPDGSPPRSVARALGDLDKSAGSSTSVDEVAKADGEELSNGGRKRRHHHHHHHKKPSTSSSNSGSVLSLNITVQDAPPSRPSSDHLSTSPAALNSAFPQSQRPLSPEPLPSFSNLALTPSATRRRPPPPPPTGGSRSNTPALPDTPPTIPRSLPPNIIPSTTTTGRRAAPEPPRKRVDGVVV